MQKPYTISPIPAAQDLKTALKSTLQDPPETSATRIEPDRSQNGQRSLNAFGTFVDKREAPSHPVPPSTHTPVVPSPLATTPLSTRDHYHNSSLQPHHYYYNPTTTTTTPSNMSTINKSTTTVRTSAPSPRAASKTSSIWAPLKACFGGSSRAAVREEQEAVDVYLKHQMRSIRNGEHFVAGRRGLAPNMATAAAEAAMGTTERTEPAKEKNDPSPVARTPKEKPLPLVPAVPANAYAETSAVSTDNSAADAVILQVKGGVPMAPKRKSLGMQHPSTRFFKERSAPRPRVEDSCWMITKRSPFAKDPRDPCPAPKRDVNVVPVESKNIHLDDYSFRTTEDFASGLRAPSRATVDSGYRSGRSSTTSNRSSEETQDSRATPFQDAHPAPVNMERKQRIILVVKKNKETPQETSKPLSVKETVLASPVLQNNNRRTPHQRKRSVKDVARAMELREEALGNQQHNTTAHARTGSQWKIQPGREPAAHADNEAGEKLPQVFSRKVKEIEGRTVA
ncbi:hypothetical protein G7K_6528-t1 [Saitoella complicata NRRL Y-17804]|uniref:Uncharacterized protein n=1 Tax=Saitoella complicata (strain BCRC 22490 / CBS 7301 / JCM 7358 / NBRC 10748 / NRRL Y-17804) TaxID=698492 RepID=A0A0E9NRG2_SAICN|nr:hypothetical protein G7K_6528-t1 [Saitoella complicata NRRL Y-17804]